MSNDPLGYADCPVTLGGSAERRREVARRLKTIEGQVRAIRRMVTEGEECVAIANQSSAALEGLRSAMRLVLRNYIEECLDVGPDLAERQAAYDQLVTSLDRFIR